MWTEESWADEADAEFVFETGRRSRAPRAARRSWPPLPRPFPKRRPRPRPRPRRPAPWLAGAFALPPRDEPPGPPSPDPWSVDLDDPAALRALQAALDRIFDQLVHRARAR